MLGGGDNKGLVQCAWDVIRTKGFYIANKYAL